MDWENHDLASHFDDPYTVLSNLHPQKNNVAMKKVAIWRCISPIKNYDIPYYHVSLLEGTRWAPY